MDSWAQELGLCANGHKGSWAHGPTCTKAQVHKGSSAHGPKGPRAHGFMGPSAQGPVITKGSRVQRAHMHKGPRAHVPNGTRAQVSNEAKGPRTQGLDVYQFVRFLSNLISEHFNHAGGRYRVCHGRLSTKTLGLHSFCFVMSHQPKTKLFSWVALTEAISKPGVEVRNQAVEIAGRGGRRRLDPRLKTPNAESNGSRRIQGGPRASKGVQGVPIL